MDVGRYLPLFLEEARSHLASALRLAEQLDEGKTTALARHLHSLKGISSSMGFLPIARIAHDCEELLADWRGTDSDRGDLASSLRSRLERCGRILLRIERRRPHASKTEPRRAGPPSGWRLRLRLLPGADPLAILDRLGSAAGRLRSCRPSRESLRRGRRPRVLAATLDTPETPSALLSLLARLPGIERFYLEPERTSLFDLLRPLVSASSALARSLGKRVRFEVDGANVRLERPSASAFLEALVHVLRNAVDHGIESPEERSRLGKRTTGVVRIRAERGRGFLRIVVEDDGRGIAPHPLPTGSAGGVPVSGRRVGLLAAAAALEPVGGRLALRGEPGRGTLVELSLPRGASRSGGGSAPSEGRRSPGPRRGRP